jgi:hypothetical protein
VDFRPLGLGDKPLVDLVLQKYPPEVSELTFTNLFCWQAKRRVSYAEIADGAAFLAAEPRRTFFLPPAGKDAAGATRAVLEYARSAGLEPVVERVPEAMAGELAGSGLRVEEDRDNWDYVYDVSDLAHLEGRKYDGKRNFVRQALAGNNCEYLHLTAGDVNDCLALETGWCNLRHCELDPGLEAEQRAIAVCFQNWAELSLIGGAVLVSGRIQAFAIGEKLNPTTAVVHFEKANPESRGLYQLINHWFVRNELSRFAYVNREQDLGVEGLRKAKESYHPHHMVRKFTVRP